MPMPVDARMLDDLRRFNRKLALAPRVRYRHRITPLLGQALLRLTQLGADAKLRRQGVRVESRVAGAGGPHPPLRVLWPGGTPRGVVLDIHGGGWVIGNPEMNDALNAATVRACNVVVVSVGYRLATEAPLASMIDDCLAALTWLLEHGLPGCAGLPLLVLGESAGAHLAAAALLKLKTSPALLQRIEGAVLYYGVYDLGGSPSVRSAGPGTLVLDGPAMLPALHLLTPGLTEAQRRTAPLSPLFGDLEGMPPALMYTGGRDPLRDDTLGMARRWGEHAQVELVDLPEAPHGLIHFPTAMGRAACAHTHGWINARLALAHGRHAMQAHAR